VVIHIFSKKSKTKYPGQYFLFYVAWYGIGRFMFEGLRPDTFSLMIWGTQLRASQWLAAVSFIVAIGILLFNRFRGGGGSGASDGGDDVGDDDDDAKDPDEDNLDEDMSDEENVEELQTLDGASEDEIKEENENEDENIKENE